MRKHPPFKAQPTKKKQGLTSDANDPDGDEATPVENEGDGEDEPVMLSLEDDDTMASVPLPSATKEPEEEDVLEAEILEADLVDDDDQPEELEEVPLPISSPTTSSRSKRSNRRR